MMPDRYVDQKSRALIPAKKPVNPYSKARRKPVAEPVPAPEGAPMQPNFAAQPTISLDPMDAYPPSMPQALIGMPSIGRGPGAQDLRTDKYSQDYARGKNLNIYQAPDEYQQHLDTVMDTPMMKELAAGVDREMALRGDFLRNAPQQSDLSPTMALADFLAKGKGTAQAGYRRPGSYEDLVGQINGMLGNEQKARQQIAQLAYEQAGGLKKGTEEAQVKSGADTGRVQGFKTPQPRMPMINPATNIGNFMKNFENIPTVKESIAGMNAAKAVRANISKNNWLGDEAAKAEILKAMKLYPVSDRDAARVTGSPDLANRVKQTVERLVGGRPITAADAHTIQQFAEYAEKRSALAANEAKDEYIAGHAPFYGLDHNQAEKALSPVIPSPTPEPEAQTNKGPSKFEEMFMQMMQGGAKK